MDASDEDLWDALEGPPAAKKAKKSDDADPAPPPPPDAPPPPPGPPDEAAPPPPGDAPPPPSSAKIACDGCGGKLTGKTLICGLCLNCRFAIGNPFRPGKLLGWSTLRANSSVLDIQLKPVLNARTGALPVGQTVEARCLRVDAPEWRYELAHCWPNGVSLFVGEERVLKKVPDQEFDEAPGPFDLTRWTYRVPNQVNPPPLKIRAGIMAKKEEHWALGVVLVDPVTDDSICEKVAKQQVPEEDRYMLDLTRVQAWVAEHRPDRVSRKDALRCVEPPVVRLVDCMSLVRISTAARGEQCDHLQCFDLPSFIHTMRNAPPKHGWCCPVCDTPTPLHRIRLDAFAQRVLDKAPENAIEVLVADTGKWEVSAVEDPLDDDSDDNATVPAHVLQPQQPLTPAQLQEALMNLGRGFKAPAAPEPKPPQAKPAPPAPQRKPSGERREKEVERKRSRSPRGGSKATTNNANSSDDKDNKMLAWQKLQGIAKEKEETRIGWLPDGAKCSSCEKSVLEKGGVWCGRKRSSGPAGGCFAAVCWKCMNKRGKEGVGGIRTTKAEFAELGPSAWWMHEACMNAEDRKAYFGEEDEEDVGKPKDQDDDEDGPATFAWE